MTAEKGEHSESFCIHRTHVCWVSGGPRAQLSWALIKSKPVRPGGLCNVLGLGPTASSLPGVVIVFRPDLNFRTPTLAPARTPDWLLSP